MTPRCTTIKLDLADFARAAEDPKLAALLADGWRVIAHVALSEDDGSPRLVLLLAPPPAKVEIPLPVVTPVRDPRSDSVWFLVVSSILFGVGVSIGSLLW
jgi:hypothetical protein